MPRWLPLVLLAVAALGFLWALRREVTVLSVEARSGRLVTLRGRAPAELVRELREVLERARATGTLALRLDRGRLEVVTAGLEPAVAQRVRNVVGRFPAARIKTGPRVG